MEKIKSFKINHDGHGKGFYLSGESDGIFTYDLRFKTPNAGDYLSNPVMHSIEHLFATVIRNSEIKDSVIYFGPMGCRTGFYLLLKNVTFEAALEYTVKALKACLEIDILPGCTRQECGNYLEHDLEGAKNEISAYASIIS